MSEIQFAWLRNVFNALRKKGVITSTEQSALEGLAEGSHLLAMLCKAGLIVIAQQPGKAPALVTRTAIFDNKTHNELIAFLRNKVPPGTKIETHRYWRISEIREWRSKSVHYVSQQTPRTIDKRENVDANRLRDMAEPEPLTAEEEAKVERDRIVGLAKSIKRDGQQSFSAMIRKNYDFHCAVTGCRTHEVLEAAHIRTFHGENRDDHSADNGILLRSDIHTLFNRYLVTFSNDGQSLLLSKALLDPSYQYLSKIKIRKPVKGLQLSEPNRNAHRNAFFAKWELV